MNLAISVYFRTNLDFNEARDSELCLYLPVYHMHITSSYAVYVHVS